MALAQPGGGIMSIEEAFLRDICGAPDDDAPRLIYADWLTDRGDPRGELIRLQVALEDPALGHAQRRQLQEREQALLQEHGRGWLGDLAPYLLDQRGINDQGEYCRYHAGAPYQFQFARGWLDLLHVPQWAVEFARVLVRAPQARLLRRLIIEEVTAEGPEEYEAGPDVPDGEESPGLYPLLQSPHLANVRTLQVGDLDGYTCRSSGEAVAELVQKMPRIEELHLEAHGIDTDTLFSLGGLGRLRALEVNACDHYPLQRLARNPALGRLTHLLLHPHGLEPGDDPYIDLAGLRAVVHSQHLRGLTHLRLRLSDAGDRGCEEIVRSGALGRLKVLDLRHGCITDAGARVLAACPALGNLELLDVSRNGLTAAGVAALERTGARVLAEDQQSAEELEAGDWLREGDME
jgi:uncharacterized protein (TIGR02996 family)